MEDAALDKAPVWSDITTFDGSAWRGKVDILSAGYPCQPFSNAGKRLGDKDPRHLWPHVRRVLGETTAPVLFVENVQGHVSLGLETVWNDLQAMGYTVEAGIFSAAEVGATHLRKRLFLLAHADDRAVRDMARSVSDQWGPDVPGRRASDGHTPGGQGMDTAVYDGHGQGARLFPPHAAEFDAWESWLAAWPDLQPALVGSHDGLAFKMDRYRLAGNGVCPLAAAYAFCSLPLHAAKA
jgi:DNA (cytosine-5)-methyltransferase 1